MVKVIRLDDRLVHGQTINNWCTSERITKILLVNEKIRRDSLRKTIIQISVPHSIEIMFLTVEEALNIYKVEALSYDLLIIFGETRELLSFILGGGEAREINIGGISYRHDREKYSNCVYLSKDEAKDLRDIQAKGIRLMIRILPDHKSIPLFK